MSKYRSKIVELYDEGFGIGRDEIFVNLLNFISESDAKEFWEQYYEDDLEEEDEIWATNYDGQPTESQEWYDFDPAC